MWSFCIQAMPVTQSGCRDRQKTFRRRAEIRQKNIDAFGAIFEFSIRQIIH
jgi:hypothetical protein